MRFFTSFAIVETSRPCSVASWANISRQSSPWAMPFLVSIVICFAMTPFLSCCSVGGCATGRPAWRNAGARIVSSCGEGGKSARSREDRPSVRFGPRRVSVSGRSSRARRFMRPSVDRDELPARSRSYCQSKRKTQSTNAFPSLTNQTKSKVAFTLAKHHSGELHAMYKGFLI